MYYSIGEMSSMVNISKDTLRYYDETGVLKPCMIDPENGYRYYSIEQAETIAGIIEYKEYGFSLEQIRVLLLCNDDAELRSALQKQEQELIRRKNRLEIALVRLRNRMEVTSMENKDKKKVLITDDSDFMRIMLSELINKHGGFIPLEAKTGEEALSLYASEKPWLVLMDIMMPGGMDGIECTEKIRRLDPDANIIIISAYDDEKNKNAAKKAGAGGFIAKPFNGNILLDLLSDRIPEINTEKRYIKF